MSIFRKLQKNARVNSERINQENFSVNLSVNIKRINKELAIARGSVRLFKILIVVVRARREDIETKVGSRSAHSLLGNKTRMQEVIMKVHYLPCRRRHKCVVLVLTLTYIHVGGNSPESSIKIVCNGKAEGIKRLDVTDFILNQRGTKQERRRVFFVVFECLHPIGHRVDAVLHAVKD